MIEIELSRPEESNVQKRVRAYPTMAEQLDMLWHAIDDGALDATSEFYTKLQAVKQRYPKE